MKLQLKLAAVLLTSVATLSEAKYFSEGWKPGQPTQRVQGKLVVGDAAAPAAAGGYRPLSGAGVATGGEFKLHNLADAKVADESPSTHSSFALSLLSTITSLTGLNLTSSYLSVQSQEAYSRVNDTVEGFVRLTDENWEEEVVYERFGTQGGMTLEKEGERVWVVLIHGPPRDPTTRIFYEAFTNASIATLEAGNDLSHVKWARMDFMSEWRSCAKWLVFRPPYIVFATDRGANLRFLSSRSIAPDGDVIRRFVKEGVWKELPVWESEWAPGGSKAWIVTSYIKIAELWSRLTSRFPTWLLLLFSGVATQTILSALHKGDAAAVRSQQAGAKQVHSGTAGAKQKEAGKNGSQSAAMKGKVNKRK